MADILDVNKWKEKLREFVRLREWGPFHNPKNLSMDIAREASELSENYIWVNTEESFDIHKKDEKVFENIRHEIGDVLMGVIMLADELNINLADALEEKCDYTAKKYPPKLLK